VQNDGGKFWGRVRWEWTLSGPMLLDRGLFSCPLRFGVSPVPDCEGPGAPSVWLLGRRDRGHLPLCLNRLCGGKRQFRPQLISEFQ
jgi:hypothetical protein